MTVHTEGGQHPRQRKQGLGDGDPSRAGTGGVGHLPPGVVELGQGPLDPAQEGGAVLVEPYPATLAVE